MNGSAKTSLLFKVPITSIFERSGILMFSALNPSMASLRVRIALTTFCTARRSSSVVDMIPSRINVRAIGPVRRARFWLGWTRAANWTAWRFWSAYGPVAIRTVHRKLFNNMTCSAAWTYNNCTHFGWLLFHAGTLDLFPRQEKLYFLSRMIFFSPFSAGGKEGSLVACGKRFLLSQNNNGVQIWLNGSWSLCSMA